LTGKVAVVTGSAGGIGGAVVQAFAGAGAEVVGLDREEADLTVAEEVEAFFTGLERVDILFNGAGISGRRFGDGPVDECTEEAWDIVLATNLKSMLLCSKHAMPLLQPLTGDFGRPEDVAGAALYLATAPFVTGTVLVVDGGWTAQ
jgi:NAD(P)-dependent dehydrogenase (short-subunit alcohol dehydrogenase family)